MEDIIDIIVTETTNLIEITSQPTDEVIDVNIIDNREDITLNVTPSVVEININKLTGNFGILWGEIEGTLSNQTDLQNALNLKADLVDGKVPSSQLPSYVDDVVEVANYASLPATGEVGKIYITLDTNFIYRWTGSTYVEIKDSSAVWGAITGTLSNQTDLQSALDAKLNTTTAASTYVPYTGATSTLNLGLRDLIASAINITGANAGGAGVLNLAKASSRTVAGSGYLSVFSDTNIFGFVDWVSANTRTAQFSLASITDNAIRTYTLPNTNGTLALTSDLHNAVTIGTANGLSLSTQVLSLGLASSSANGALSSTDWTTFNNKLSTATAASTYVPYTGATGAVNLGAYDLTVNGITVGIGAGNMSSNTAIGASVLASNTNGSNNAALGYLSLNSNTTGGANTAIGSQTLKSNTNGTFNIAVGYGSLFNSVSANYNTAIGNSALYNTTGSSNTAIGDGAGYNITTGIFNTLIGGYFGTSSMSYNVILSDGARNIRFQFDGTNTLLGQSGNVLINTSTNAGYKLDVNGTGRFTGALSGTSATFSGAINLTGTANSFQVASIFRNANRVFFGGDTGGYFFQNSANSVTVLQIADSGAATFSSSVTATQGTFSSTAGNQLVAYYGASDYLNIQHNGLTTKNNQMNLGTNLSATPTMALVGTNVGIGTTAPTTYSLAGRHLELNDAGGGYAFIHVNTTSVKSFLAADNADGSAGLYTFSNHFLKFGTNNTERMRITSGGVLLVNQTSLSAASAGSKMQISADVLSTGTLAGFFWENRSGGVTSNSNWYGWYTTSGTIYLYNGASNVASINPSTGVYLALSDKNKKKNFEVSNIGLNEIMKLKPTLYNMKSDSEGESKQLGFIAQEVKDVLPQAYVQTTTENEDFIGLNFNPIVAALTKAVQELKAELDTLKNK